MSRRCDRVSLVATATFAALAVSTTAPQTFAQSDFSVEASQVHQPGAGENNAAEALLAALAEMDAPPASIPDTPTALLMLVGDEGWPEAKKWATSPNQRAMLNTLRDVTNPGNPHVFALPYGLKNTSPAIQKTGLAIDLGDPPLLAAASLYYLDALDELFALVSIDAARLAEEGDPEAVFKLIQWVRLSRMVADQPLSVEKRWAIHSMRLGVMRLLDLFALNPELMNEREIIRLVRETKERELRIERIQPPYADRIAMHELVAATYTERRGPNPSTFGPTLAALMSEGQPLGLFGEAAYFQNVAEQQANWFDTTETIDAIYNDWERRWAVPHYDRVWSQQMERRLIDPARYSLIEEFSPDLYSIFQDRLDLRADLAGARMAISVIGYRRGKGVWPSDLAAIRPTFVDNIDTDPFHDGGDRFVKQFEILKYFVPIRDQKFGARVDPHPHAIRVFRAGDIFGGLSLEGAEEITEAFIDEFVDKMVNDIDNVSRDSLRLAFMAVTDELTKHGITKSNYKSAVSEMSEEDVLSGFAPQTRGAKTPNLKEFLGVDMEMTPDMARGLLTDQLRLMFEDSDFSAAFSASKNGRRIDADLNARGVGAAIRAVAYSLMNLQRRIMPSSFGPDHFDIELDDDNFVIYARGIDLRADWAREVGPGAADFLIWPPVLTLLRSELRQEPPMAAWAD